MLRFVTRFVGLRALTAVVMMSIILAAGGVHLPAVEAATTLTVNTTTDEVADNSVCSLREAVIFANNGAGEDACGTDSSGPYTIELANGATYGFTIAGAGENAAATGDLDISVAVTIQATGGTGFATVDANDLDRVFHVLSGAQLVLRGITVTDGSLNAAGASGAGIHNAGTLTLLGSVITENVNLSNSDQGGGIYNATSATATLVGTTVSNNSAGDAIAAGIGGSGGGILNVGTLTIGTSTISGNTADDGGGIFNAGTLTMVNSTVSTNTARNAGGGIFNNGTVATTTATLGHVTITLNTANFNVGTGLRNNGPLANVTFSNSIVADQTSGTDCGEDSSPAFVLNGNNLDSDGTCFGGTGGAANLGPLAGNGGPTQTHELLSGSGALDSADSTVCQDSAFATDQRGEPRPFDGDGDGTAVCDIGAFEAQENIEEPEPEPSCDLQVAQVAPIARCLIILKETIPDGALDDFDFNVAINTPQQPQQVFQFDLQDDEFRGFPLLVLGTIYSITESATPGWELVDIACPDLNGVTVTEEDVANGTLSLTFVGDTTESPYAVCVFENEAVDDPETPVPSPSPRPSRTPLPNLGGALSGLFGPPPAVATPQPVAVAPAVTSIRPPSTGDGGLR